MTELLRPRWCTYCGKDNHNDIECWSTRPVNWRPEGVMPIPMGLGDLAPMTRALQDWLRAAAEGKN